MNNNIVNIYFNETDQGIYDSTWHCKSGCALWEQYCPGWLCFETGGVSGTFDLPVGEAICETF